MPPEIIYDGPNKGIYRDHMSFGDFIKSTFPSAEKGMHVSGGNYNAIDFMLPQYLVMVAFKARSQYIASSECITNSKHILPTKAEVKLLGNESKFGEVEKIILEKSK
jgi:hypothetical protein